VALAGKTSTVTICNVMILSVKTCGVTSYARRSSSASPWHWRGPTQASATKRGSPDWRCLVQLHEGNPGATRLGDAEKGEHGMWFWVPIWFMVVGAIVGLLALALIAGTISEYADGRWRSGVEHGRKQGHDEGYREGYAAGQQAVYDQQLQFNRRALDEAEAQKSAKKRKRSPYDVPPTSSPSPAPAYRAYASADRADRERLTRQTRSVEQFPNQRQLPRGS
jgi:hypothetical protein